MKIKWLQKKTWTKSLLVLFNFFQAYWGHQSNPSFHKMLEGKLLLREQHLFFLKERRCGQVASSLSSNGIFIYFFLAVFCCTHLDLRQCWVMPSWRLDHWPRSWIPSNTYMTGSLPTQSTNIIALFCTLPLADSSHAGRRSPLPV